MDVRVWIAVDGEVEEESWALSRSKERSAVSSSSSSAWGFLTGSTYGLFMCSIGVGEGFIAMDYIAGSPLSSSSG